MKAHAKSINQSLSVSNEIIKEQSALELARAKQLIQGGFNAAPSFKSFNGTSLFINNAKGAKITDVDRNEYIDFHLSGGAQIMGHASEKVISMVAADLWNTTTKGASYTSEVQLTKVISEAMPSVEKIRFTNSGAEAVTSAIRLARAYTGRDKIVKFDGAYHGNSDQLLVSPGSGLEAPINSISPGIPGELIQHTISIPFNNEDALLDVFLKYRNQIAAVIIEPVSTSFGLILPTDGFLNFLRGLTLQHKSLLIFDEETTGFRPRISGAQGYYDVAPDITILGKIIGGGFSIGAFGGRNDIMALLSPEGEVLQAGSSNNNHLAMNAGVATLKYLGLPQFYEPLNHKSRDFIFYLEEITKGKGITVNSFKSMFTLYFNSGKVTNYDSALRSNTDRFEQFHGKLQAKGIFLSPTQFGANFISSAHTPEDLNRTINTIYQVLKTI